MTLLRYVTDCIDRLVRIVSGLSNCILFLTMLLMVVTIALRIIGVTVSGIPSLTEMFFVASIYFTIAYVQQTKTNIAVDLFILRLPGGAQQILRILQLIVPLVFCVLVISASWDFALDSWQIKEEADGEPFYPIYPAKIVVALGVTLLLIQVLSDLLREIALYITKSREGQF